MTSPSREAEVRAALRPIYRSEETRGNLARWLAKRSKAERAGLAAALLDGAGVAAGDGDVPTDGRGQDRKGPAVRTLAELLEDPEILRPPEAVAPRFAWRGRLTLLAAREKRGKSTLAAACAASVTRGRSLMGDACEAGPVLWLALEEHPADLARKLVAFDADPEALYIVSAMEVERPLEDLTAAVDFAAAALVVVDTLPAYADLLEESPDPGSSREWTRVLVPLVRIARETDAAIMLLHHADKIRGQYRDSTAIGANVDVILEMHEDRDHPGVRKMDCRARWRVDPWSYRLEGEPMDPSSEPRLVIVEGGPTIREQVIAHVHAEPGTSQRQVERAVTGRAKDVREAVQALLREGVIEDHGGPRGGRSLHSAENPHGHATDAVRTQSGRSDQCDRVLGVPPSRREGTPDALISDAPSNRRLVEVDSCECGAPIAATEDRCAGCREVANLNLDSTPDEAADEDDGETELRI